jgi:hypothetical protein
MFKKMNFVSSILFKDRFNVPFMGHRMSLAEILFSLGLLGGVAYILAPLL